jgi:[acyl-carrier-protein] S-malonyltransferase
MDFEEAVALVQKRGRFMTEAVPSGEGAMYAIIGLEQALVEESCKEAVDAGLGLAVPANYNAPGQIVIAGKTGAVDKAAKIAKEKGAKLTVKLKVSGPFHTELLQPASDRLKPELEKMTISDMKIPVYTNVNAQVVPSKEDIIPLLTKQICCPVRWEDIVRNMAEQGADTFIELGPGKALAGFVKRTLKGVNIMNVEDISSLDKTVKKLNEIV